MSTMMITKDQLLKSIDFTVKEAVRSAIVNECSELLKNITKYLRRIKESTTPPLVFTEQEIFERVMAIADKAFYEAQRELREKFSEEAG